MNPYVSVMSLKEVWILGAAGRSGRAVAEALVGRQMVPVLVGRNEAALRALAEKVGGSARVVVATSIEEIGAELRKSGPAVVFNTIGPFAATAVAVIRASAPGSHYCDLANELPAAIDVLALNDEMASSGRCVVTGAGFGVLATESLVLKLCEGRPPAERVRVAAIPFVDAPGLIGPTLAATIIDGIPAGASRYENGRLVRVGFGADAEVLTLPDGSKVSTAGVPTGDMEAARRASGARFAVSASSMAPSGLLIRAFMPFFAWVLSWRAARELVKRRVAAIRVGKAKGPPKPSWTHARVEWTGGKVREGWLRAGDAMDFTTYVATEVAFRLAQDDCRPGAYTPGALFDADLAVAAGGTFLLDEAR